ncbi:hypothetical protein H704_00197 [Bartonella bacilliformis Peru38]|nr:hypothetical protein H704_00197 [Bartonella bacilliformis Peru38]
MDPVTITLLAIFGFTTLSNFIGMVAVLLHK